MTARPKGTVKIDHETGTHLLNGINWLDSWLRIRRLDKHKRPLNILIQVANLLATPRKQLLKVAGFSTVTTLLSVTQQTTITIQLFTSKCLTDVAQVTA
ncbi:unnamed protein product [Schistosoma curassoni]|uniref:Tnp_DDE_dom domain-containing protein n=1 Tax=Schistosoma curassoni TaxID=6186 RepID=A0A183KVR3_9TREM|nr:unnamed protein product [Schistosoma curassoni]